jgi:hypothetical protein
MKSRLEKVYGKLPNQKVSLKKVELSLIDDISSLVTRGQILFKNLNDGAQESKVFFSEIESIKQNGSAIEERYRASLSEAIDFDNEANSLINRTKQSADDLGIDVSSINGFEKLDELWRDIEGDASILEEWADEIKNL